MPLSQIGPTTSPKIAVLLPELVAQGGGDRQALHLARELQDMGHRVSIYTPVYDRRCYPQFCKGLDIVVTGRHPLSRLPLPSGRLRAWLDMRHLAARVPPGCDVLNPHYWPPHWAAVRAAAASPLPPAVVWMCNDPPWPPARPFAGPTRLLSGIVVHTRRADSNKLSDRANLLSDRLNCAPTLA